MESNGSHIFLYAGAALVALYAIFLLRQVVRELKALNQHFRRSAAPDRESSRSSSSAGRSSRSSASSSSGGGASGSSRSA